MWPDRNVGCSLSVARVCQMMKLKQFSNEFDVLYSKDNNPFSLGECSASQAVECCSYENGARLSFIEVRRGNRETGHDWLGGQEFPFRLVYVLGKLGKAELEKCDGY